MDNIPLEKELIEAIRDTVIFLKGRSYSKVLELPYVKGNLFSIVNDVDFFLGKKDSIFKSSFLYNLRRWLFNNKELIILYDFFIHNKKETYLNICFIIGEDRVKRLLSLNILSKEFDRYGNSLLRSKIRVIPFNGEYFISDSFDRTISDFVWIGIDSIFLASKLKCLNNKGKWAIDIGSGSGIQAITLSNDSKVKVIAIDINEKGLRYGKINAIINNKTNIHFVKSDMLSAIKGSMDTIVSNPPFIFLPDTEKLTNRDGYGGLFGIEKIIYILEKIPQYLNPEGRAVLLTLSPVISGKDILMEEIKRLFDKNYVIDYEIIDYIYMNEFRNLYDSKNISYFIQGILKISNNGNSCAAQISVKDISKIKKLLSFIKIAGKKAFHEKYVHTAL